MCQWLSNLSSIPQTLASEAFFASRLSDRVPSDFLCKRHSHRARAGSSGSWRRCSETRSQTGLPDQDTDSPTCCSTTSDERRRHTATTDCSSYPMDSTARLASSDSSPVQATIAKPEALFLRCSTISFVAAISTDSHYYSEGHFASGECRRSTPCVAWSCRCHLLDSVISCSRAG